MEWKSATVEEVKQVIQKDLSQFNEAQIATFRKYGAEPYIAPILRHEKLESVVVVARRRDGRGLLAQPVEAWRLLLFQSLHQI